MTEIYNHWRDECSANRVGHIDDSGVVYNHWRDEYSANRIGHVGSDGVIYNHWRDEYSANRVGHAKGKLLYAAGAALLLLLYSLGGGDSSGGRRNPVLDMSDEEWEAQQKCWRGESAERQYQMRNQQEINAQRARTFKRYESNTAIVSAAKEHAKKSAKNAALLTAAAFLVIFVIGTSGKGFDASVIMQTFMYCGVFAGGAAAFTARIAYKESYSKKVWELGQKGFVQEPPKQTTIAKEPTAKPSPTPKPVSAQKSTPNPTAAVKAAQKPAPRPQPVGSKIAVCPYCGAKARIPVGKGRIRFTCPSPSCGKKYEIDS